MGNEEMREIFRDFDALAIREKVETAISLAEQYNANAAQGGINFFPIDRIRVDDQIEAVAEALGLELQEFQAPSGDYLYYFYYNGWQFDQVSKEKIKIQSYKGE